MYPFINHNQNDVISKTFWKNLHTLFYTLLTAESMKAAKKTVSEEFGEKQETKSFYGQEVTQKGKHYAVCQIQISYENVSVIYTLTFDQDMKLAGIFLK